MLVHRSALSILAAAVALSPGSRGGAMKRDALAHRLTDAQDMKR